jgi:hypothetical protein
MRKRYPILAFQTPDWTIGTVIARPMRKGAKRSQTEAQKPQDTKLPDESVSKSILEFSPGNARHTPTALQPITNKVKQDMDNKTFDNANTDFKSVGMFDNPTVDPQLYGDASITPHTSKPLTFYRIPINLTFNALSGMPSK